MNNLCWCLVMAGLCWPSLGTPAEILENSVRRHEQEFIIHVELAVDASVTDVRAIVSQLNKLSRLSKSVIASEVSSVPSTETIRLRVVLRPCVLWFCRTIVKVSAVKRIQRDRWEFEGLPELSDFRSARESLTVGFRDGRSVLRYDAALVPGFFVPRIIGVWAVRHVIARELRHVAHEIERLSH